MRLPIRHLLFIAVGLVLSGCVSPSFERAWKKPSGESPTQKWAGSWESERHGAKGRLRAVTGAPKDGRVDVFFEAGWHGFTTAYPVLLASENKGGTFLISGQHDLKSFIGGGVYTYSGTMTGDLFFTRYQSKYDTGTFTLKPVSVK